MTNVPSGFDSGIGLHFALDDAEWGRAARATYLALPGVRSFRLILRTVPVAMALPLCVALLLGTGPIGGILPAFVACEGVAIVVLFFHEFWSRVLPQLEVRQMRSGVENLAREERYVSEQGLFVRGNQETTLLPWSLIVSVTETPEFLFFRGPSATHFIPKRLLDTDDLVRVRRFAASTPTATARGAKAPGLSER
jgi:hypothetical protein